MLDVVGLQLCGGNRFASTRFDVNVIHLSGMIMVKKFTVTRTRWANKYKYGQTVAPFSRGMSSYYVRQEEQQV